MIELGANNLSKSFGVDKIFENVTFDIKTKEKVGLIGSNGTGKTTLMKMLTGDENYQEGEIYKRKENKIGYLEQIPDYPVEYTVIDVLNNAFSDIYDIKTQMNKLEGKFDSLEGKELEKVIERYGRLQNEFQRLGGYDLEEKISKTTIGLNISPEMQLRKFNNLSGGEKSRIILGKILLEEPDILLLDEPSNHLDIKSIEWLEGYLKEYRGSVLIISHDRYFLDRVVEKIFELTSNGMQTYKGNYSHYVVEKELRFIQAMNEYKNQQRKIKKMEEQIERYRIWGKMRDSDKMYKRAKELEKRLEKIDQIDKPILEQKSLRLNSGISSRTGKEVLRIENVYKSFGKKRILEDISINVYYQDRLGIFGNNGTGKSTLLKMIMGKLEVDSGSIKLGSRLKIGYLPQEIIFDNENISLLDLFCSENNITIIEARKELAKALFSEDDVYKHVSSLSGGEKSRLKLAMLIYQKVNVLILDEPTNHLDIDSREVLEESLADYEGTIIFVSHDRYFVNKIASRIAEIEDGRLKIYNYNYEGYKAEKARINEKVIIKEKESNKVIEKVSKNKLEYKKRNEEQKYINKLKNRLLKIENSINDLENTIENIEKQMIENSTDADKLNELYSEADNKKTELEQAYEDWERTNNELEELVVN